MRAALGVPGCSRQSQLREKKPDGQQAYDFWYASTLARGAIAHYEHMGMWSRVDSCGQLAGRCQLFFSAVTTWGSLGPE